MTTTPEFLATIVIQNGMNNSIAFEQVANYVLSGRYADIPGKDVVGVGNQFIAYRCTTPPDIELVKNYLDTTVKQADGGYIAQPQAHQGLAHADTFDDTLVHIDLWQSVEVITDAVFVQLEYKDGTISLQGQAVSAGNVITGEIQSFQLASGSVRATRNTTALPLSTPFTWTSAPAGSGIIYNTVIGSSTPSVQGDIKPIQDPTKVAVVDLTITDSVVQCGYVFTSSPFTTVSFPNLNQQEFGSFNGFFFRNNLSLTTVSLPNLYRSWGHITFDLNPLLTDVTLPTFYSLDYGSVYIQVNNSLATVSIPNWASFSNSEVWVTDNPILQSVDLRSLPGTWWGFNVKYNAILTSLHIEAFTRTDQINLPQFGDVFFAVHDNPLLKDIHLTSVFQPSPIDRINVKNNDLKLAVVNNILGFSFDSLYNMGLVFTVGGLSTFQLLMDGGGNKTPSAQYISHAVSMTNAGALVTYNP